MCKQKLKGWDSAADFAYHHYIAPAESPKWRSEYACEFFVVLIPRHLEPECFLNKKGGLCLHRKMRRGEFIAEIFKLDKWGFQGSRKDYGVNGKSSFLSGFLLFPLKRGIEEEGSLENVIASHPFPLYFSWYFSEDKEMRRHIWLQERKTLLQFVWRSLCKVCFGHSWHLQQGHKNISRLFSQHYMYKMVY